jgi:hypothetical protein
VTPQTAQIQELVRQIDDALRKSAPRFPWLQSSEAAQQRQVLQQTRSYLLVLQQQAREAEDRPLTGSAAKSEGVQSAETAQQVLQAVLQEMNYLRSNMLQPLRADIDALQQRRSALVQEVQQLEAQRQQQALPAGNQQFVAELLQSSMQQLQENLTGQVAGMLASLSAQVPAEQPLLEGSEVLSPAQRLQQMQRLQAQSDQLTMRLDSAIRIIFESMHTNIRSYEDSLEQGLNRMHTLGQQGEAMFSALVNRLAEHLGRETSTYLQSSIQAPSLGAAVPGTVPGAVPGTEEIDQLLGELNALEQKNQAADLEQLDLSLDPLDFSEDEDITVFQHEFHDFDDEDVTRFQDGSEQMFPVQMVPVQMFPVQTDDPEDLSSALDLLNQLNGGETPIDTPLATTADDEFYQSLFGEGADGEQEVVAPEITPVIDEPIAALPIEDSPIEETAAETSTTETEPVSATELADVSDLFFSGMGDPADAPEAETAAPLEFADAELAQSVEAFLLKVPEPEEVAAEPSLETIASLTELVGLPDAPDALQLEQFEENTYEPARPEESLIADLNASQPVRIDLDALPDEMRQLLESDLSNLEFSDSIFDPPPVAPQEVQADMTLFDDDFDAENPATLMEVFAGTNGTELPDTPIELDPADFDFSKPDLSANSLSLEACTTPDPNPESTPENSMSQDHSSTPTNAFSTSESGEFNAFSFDGLDDELFEENPASESDPDGRSLDPEELLKKKRSRVKGERSRGFGR